MCSHFKDVESDTFVPFVSKNVVSVSDISAVNLIVGGKLFACRRNSSISCLLVSHTDMTSSIMLFQKMGLMLLCLSISFPILVMKMLANSCPWLFHGFEDDLSR